MYLSCVPRSLQVRPAADALRSDGDMEQSEVLEFFNACVSLMGTPEAKKELAAAYADTQEPPNELIISMQRDILSCLGIEPEFGVGCLGKAVQNGSAEIRQEAQRFAMSAQRACQEAVMGTEKFEATMTAQAEAAARQQRLMASVNAMSAHERAEFMKRMGAQQVKMARAMLGMRDDRERVRYVQALPLAEQEDLARFNIL